MPAVATPKLSCVAPLPATFKSQTVTKSLVLVAHVADGAIVLVAVVIAVQTPVVKEKLEKVPAESPINKKVLLATVTF